MSDKAYITPNVLKWARESARISVEIAAQKVHVPAEALIDWESGLSQPTISQAEKLAKYYKRPFALFFLPNIPKDFQPLQDFRTKGAADLSTASLFIIREIQQKQAWISEYFIEDNEPPLPFVGKFSLASEAAEVAHDILNTLQIEPGNYNTDSPIREWVNNAEKQGIFVSRTSFINPKMKLDSNELQGFVISDNYAPFVFVNSEDWNSAQLFSLVHELAHIWIAESGISSATEYSNINQSTHPIELFCNEVAANALMPVELMQSIGDDVYRSTKDIFAVSKRLGVSSFAFLYRAFKLGIIPREIYISLKEETELKYQEFLEQQNQKKNKKGGPNYYLLQLNRNGRLFTQTVLDSFRGGQIQPTQASALLNTKINYFSKLEVQLYK